MGGSTGATIATGGLNKVSNAVNNAVIGKKLNNQIADVLIKPFENMTYKLPLGLITDVVFQGESLKGTFAKHNTIIAGDLARSWSIVGNQWLGINDDGFLGIKGGIFSKIGQFLQDLLHDHVDQTLGIGIIVAVLFVSIFYPPAYSLTSAVLGTEVAAMVAAGSASMFLSGVWYITYAIISYGVSALFNTMIDGAVLSMYGSQIFDTLLYYEELQETIRIVNLAAILDGSIFDKMAGGWMYASQFAGDVYYDATTVGNCNISVGGQFNLTPHAVQVNIGYIDTTMKNLAGNDNFSVVSLTI